MQTYSPSSPAAATTPATGAELERLIARGRYLQSLAMRAAFRRAGEFMISGCSLRGLRVVGQRQPCC